MSFPRTHTWLHLLPADIGFECAACPPWLAEPLAARTSTRGHRAMVTFGQAIGGSQVDALIAINGKKIHNDALSAQGFSHVRRFAVLPGWEDPRWFIPLAAPAVSAAGLDLYAPARRLARLKKAAVRAAALTRIPIWYRDHILIAQRRPPALEDAMASLFPKSRIWLALSSGAPEGAINRKASAVVIDSSGGKLAFLKLARSELAASLLRHEAQVLGALGEVARLQGLVPRLLSAQEIDGGYVTAQSPVAGGPAPIAINSVHRAFLDRLNDGARVVPRETEHVQALQCRIEKLTRPNPHLANSLQEALAVLDNQRLSAAIVHGDFAPWNLRRHEGRVGAFDWEYGSLCGPAGLDEIHYRLQVGYLLNGWSIEQAAGELIRTDVLNRYLAQPDESGRSGLVMLYLVDVLARLLDEGYDRSNKMVDWNLQLLSRAGAASAREMSVS